MLAAGTLLVILGLVGVGYGIYAQVRAAGGTRKGAWDLSLSARSTRWRALGC
jgi:hypothetical protein